MQAVYENALLKYGEKTPFLVINEDYFQDNPTVNKERENMGSESKLLARVQHNLAVFLEFVLSTTTAKPSKQPSAWSFSLPDISVEIPPLPRLDIPLNITST